MAITLDDIKRMPLKRKALIAVVICLLLGGVYFYIFLQPDIQKKGSREATLSDLEKKVADQERIAAQKSKYEKEVDALKETLKLALAKLPDQREIPGLLYAVAQAGKDAGIDFLLFEPKQSEKKPQETQKEGAKPADKKTADAKGSTAKQTEEQFYEEIPVRVTVSGNFHSIVVFFEKVAKLPRIINIEDITMYPGKEIKGLGRPINTSCVIKTYMFVEKLEGKKVEEKK
ncbi:MAG TPA: type 4a pilus biogenesis protein PilO [Syntrophales bacterium]|nr:type 4a pilus biogenesis protein PilO [Syntrophales bacterium]